jgi:hypothetical protein
MGVCADGTVSTCEGSSGWACSGTSALYEADEMSCDTEDNDCDGVVDESPDCPGSCDDFYSFTDSDADDLSGDEIRLAVARSTGNLTFSCTTTDGTVRSYAFTAAQSDRIRAKAAANTPFNTAIGAGWTMRVDGGCVSSPATFTLERPGTEDAWVVVSCEAGGAEGACCGSDCDERSVTGDSFRVRDCGPEPICPDGTCDRAEDCNTCPADCGACTSGACSARDPARAGGAYAGYYWIAAHVGDTCNSACALIGRTCDVGGSAVIRTPAEAAAAFAAAGYASGSPTSHDRTWCTPDTEISPSGYVDDDTQTTTTLYYDSTATSCATFCTAVFRGPGPDYHYLCSCS